MFGKKKNTPPVETTENSDVQFEKNIKTLWLYTLLFCAFALVLIVVSSVVQGKINSDAEYYQDQYENAQTSNQSTLKNIQDENAALKKDNDLYKSENLLLSEENEADKQLINNANAMLENAEYLLLAQKCLDNKDKVGALENLSKVSPDMLSETMTGIYEELTEQLVK